MNQEFTNASSGKIERGMLWIVGTIWANIIIVALITGLAIQLLLMLIGELGNHVVVSTLIPLFYLGMMAFAIRLGVKSVLAKSIIKKEKILKISIWVGALPILLSIGITETILMLAVNVKLIMILIIVTTAMVYAGITYFWCKRLVK